MTSGTKTTRAEPRRAALGALLLAAVGAAHAFDLPALAAMLATHASGQARFTEQRWAQGLDQPLASSGTLSFAAPDRFTRRTLQPRAETLAVEGNTLTMSRGGRSRTLALDAVPEAAVAVEAIRGTLTGDAAALQRDFEASVAGDAEHWTLALVPREAGGPLASVRIAGHRDVVQTVETRLADGGRSVMTITPLPAGADAAASAQP
jgi:hypothetical protein